MNVSLLNWQLETLGWARSCFPEKFAVPRQPSLVPSALTCIEMAAPFNRPEMVAGLEDFSHLWLSFVFHQNLNQGWKSKVRPPRLGGNAKVGVFASRSSFRPNGLGLSVVELAEIDTQGGVKIWVKGADLVDGTPIVDIKPYIPWIDSQPTATAAWVPGPPPSLPVEFSPEAEAAIKSLFAPKLEKLSSDKRNLDKTSLDRKSLNQNTSLEVRQLISEVLAQNPRPAYQKTSQRVYGMSLNCFQQRLNVSFCYTDSGALVVLNVSC